MYFSLSVLQFFSSISGDNTFMPLPNQHAICFKADPVSVAYYGGGFAFERVLGILSLGYFRSVIILNVELIRTNA